jgi:uncharacterized protein YihD (DUF1040 family)
MLKIQFYLFSFYFNSPFENMEIKIGMSGKYLLTKVKILKVFTKDNGFKKEISSIINDEIIRFIKLEDIDIEERKIKFYENGKITTIDSILITIYNRCGETQLNVVPGSIGIKELEQIITERITKFLENNKEKVLNLNEFLKKLDEGTEIMKVTIW